MTKCRVCRAEIGPPIYSASAPAITSLAHLMDVPTQSFACQNCGHGQSSDLPDENEFYDKQYRISLASDDYDQLCAFVDGKPVYRTDLQAELILAKVELRDGARLLDFGAAKATTLRKVFNRRPDIMPHVFDMSSDYMSYWADFIDPENRATYEVPANWSSSFDVVTAHFVLEHVSQPSDVLRKLHDLLVQGGSLFMSVPSAIENPGDMIAVDHVNHFTDVSLRRVLQEVGFDVVEIDRAAFNGALIVVARRSVAGAVDAGLKASAQLAAAELRKVGEFWGNAKAELQKAAQHLRGRRCAIYGAGVYGLYVYSRISDLADVRCFIDRNPHVRMAQDMACPVVAVSDLPEDIDVIFAGLNPKIARLALSNVPEWTGRSLQIVYLD